MTDQETTTKCAGCEAEGPHDNFYWMAYSMFCERCIRRYESQGWARPKPDYLKSYELTESGGRAMPELEPVAYCGTDGMPIYRRWIAEGAARGMPEPACPYCLRTAGER
jgi:hypothetical protein